MRVVTLKEDREIDGILRRKGEVLVVPDNWNEELIDKVLNEIPDAPATEEGVADGTAEPLS